ncbi:hypothetical protein KFL_009380020 [Klebsormidium nitens]|uniref:GAG-pre-integrase domain-containing protein n=1 Tax=Klebsormidium nitens TaxID=105231 RepID=A0A1Y1IND0_KLENI|nr:hypothetical protein KFL_009380020 [Klebsormidium nitens]|eukprot:GAQ92173.1 hypothetical protein KFL_009380020 [Klebsormidium nitens]
MEREGAAPGQDACFLVKKPETAELWHRRMGHAGYENLAKMVQDNLVEGVGLEEKVPAMLEDSGLLKEMCAEAVVTANYTRNRTPVSAHGRTPWEAFYGKKPNVGHMRVFGAQAYMPHIYNIFGSKIEVQRHDCHSVSHRETEMPLVQRVHA